MLTTSPGADVAPYHNRQIVVLWREAWGAWLDATKPENEVLKSFPPGTMIVEAATS